MLVTFQILPAIWNITNNQSNNFVSLEGIRYYVLQISKKSSCPKHILAVSFKRLVILCKGNFLVGWDFLSDNRKIRGGKQNFVQSKEYNLFLDK